MTIAGPYITDFRREQRGGNNFGDRAASQAGFPLPRRDTAQTMLAKAVEAEIGRLERKG